MKKDKKQILEKHTGILGKTRSGKTHFFTKYLFKKSLIRGIIFDIKNDDTIGQLNYPVVNKPESINFKKTNKWILRRSVDESKEDFVEKVTYLINKYFKSNAHIYFFIDEIGQYCSKHKLPETFEKLFTMGLGKNKYCVWNTQRPQSIHNDVITQTTDYFVFNISKNDYKWLKNFGYVEEGGLEWIKNKYHYIYYDGVNYKYNKPI